MGTIYPGEYTFTFYDSDGDGLQDFSNYALWINDQVVACGSGDFDLENSTTFTIGVGGAVDYDDGDCVAFV